MSRGPHDVVVSPARRGLITAIAAVFIALVRPAGVFAEPLSAEVVGRAGLVPLSLTPRLLPEEWALPIPAADIAEASRGVLMVFPKLEARLLGVRAEAGLFDALVLDERGRVVSVEVNDDGRRPLTLPAAKAVIVLRGGQVGELGLAVGDWVHVAGIDLASKSIQQGRAGERRPDVERRLRDELRKHPDDAGSFEALLRYYEHTGQLGQAERLFVAEVRRRPRGAALVGLALARASLGEKRAARTLLVQALGREPGLLQAYGHLIRLDATADELRALVEPLAALCRTSPAWLEGALTLARLQLALGRLSDSAAILARLPQVPEVLRLGGDLFLREGDTRAAADAYERFLRLRPNHPDAAEIRAFILLHRERASRPATGAR